MLTYKEISYSQKTIEKEVKIPKNWGMFSAQGNQIMRKKAESLVKNILKVKEKNPCDIISYLKCFDKYFKSYQKTLSTNKNYKEAGDTCVREMIWGFAESVGKSLGISEETLDELWNVRHDYKK